MVRTSARKVPMLRWFASTAASNLIILRLFKKTCGKRVQAVCSILSILTLGTPFE